MISGHRLTLCFHPEQQREFCSSSAEQRASFLVHGHTDIHVRTRGKKKGTATIKRIRIVRKERPQEAKRRVKQRRRLNLRQTDQSQQDPSRTPAGPQRDPGSSTSRSFFFCSTSVCLFVRGLPANHAAAQHRRSRPLQTAL